MTSSSVAALIALAAPWAHAGQLRLYEAVAPHMGTLVKISLYTHSEQRAREGFRAGFARIAGIDRALSDYLPESELNRLCRAPAGKPVPVSEDLFRVLAASQELAAETEGAFDVTLGPVTGLWRQARRDRLVPSPEALRDARARSGYRKLHLDSASRTAWLERAGMQLDAGGIGKGYAADQALAALRAMGIGRALVAASGDLAIGDPPPGERGWRVGVTAERVLELSNRAVSSSGAAEQHAEIGGVTYSHIIDPATGLGLTAPLTVTVVARLGIDADSLATAVSVLGETRGLALVERRGAAVLIAGQGRISASSGWREWAK